MAEEQVTTKAHFLELHHTYFTQLASLLARFTDEQKTTLNVFEDWTLKDVMAHIASWHQDAIEVLDAALHNREPQIPIEIDWDYIHKRNAGFYVLAVFYKDRFIARLDSRLDGCTWTISRWWWEPDMTPDVELNAALSVAVQKFLYYLRADELVCG